MDNRGFLLTNHHVISGADEILILLQDGREALATVIGSDPATDLAVLKIGLNNLNPIQVGNPNTAQVGDIVLAIGNPYGFGQTVTQGIISATGRYGLQLNIYENYLQTDAAINPGNSGGALINTKGELLGINSAIYSRSGGSNGIGLAIPSDTAITIMNDLISYGEVIRGWLGIEVKSLNAVASQALQLPKGAGVMITNMIIDSPAHQAKLEIGDVITHINGIGISDGNIGMNLIAQTRPGETVTINIIRNQQAAKISVIAGRRPE